MGRTCCVPTCQSSVKVPSHKFPKNPQRCFEWIQSLKLDHLRNYCADQLQKYKVCHKHFTEEQYSVSLHHRFLLSTAIPIPFVTDDNTEANNVQHSSQQQCEKVIQNSQIAAVNTSQNTGTMALFQQNEQLQPKELHVNNQMVLENIVTQSISKNNTLEQQIQNHEQRMENVETEIIHIKKMFKRRQLQEITRAKALTPVARRLYNMNIKLKRQNLYLKRLVKHRKLQDKKKKTVQHSTANASSSSVQERFMNMMLRNKDVPCQVYNDIL